MTARRRLLILAALLVVLLVSLLRLGVFFSAGLLARGLRSFFERDVHVGAVEVHFFPLRTEVVGFRVAGKEPLGPPFLEIGRVVAIPSLAQFWERKLVLRELRLESPRVRINAYRDGGDDLPPFGRGEAGGGDVRLDRLVVQEGEILLDHERVPLEADLPDFQGRFDVRSDRALAGRLTFGPGPLQFGTAPPLELGSEIALVLAGRRLIIEKGVFHAPNIALEAKGEIRFGSPLRGEIQLTGPVDLRILDEHVVRTGLGLAGAARIDGTLSLTGAKIEISGRAAGDLGVFDGVPVPRYAGDFAWDGNGLRLTGLAVEALSGRASLDIEVPSAVAAREARVVGRLEEIDVEGLLAMIFNWGRPGVGAGATGEVALRWPRGRPRELTGRVALELAPRPDGRTPLSGRFLWSAEAGDQRLELADLHTPPLDARLEGRVLADGRADLRLDAEGSDLGGADALVRRLRRALGNAEAADVGLAGTGVFRGRWTGTLAEPVFEGRFTGQELVWRRVLWGEATAAGALSATALEARSLLLHRGSSTLFLDARFGVGSYGLEDDMEGRARLSAWPVQDLVSAFGWDLPLEGVLTGEASFRGRRSAPAGDATLEVAAGRFGGTTFTEGRAKVTWGEGATRVLEGRALLGEGEALFSGSVTEDGIYDGEGRPARGRDLLPAAGGFRGAPRRSRSRPDDPPGSPASSPARGFPACDAALPGRRGPGGDRGAVRRQGRRRGLGDRHLPFRARGPGASRPGGSGGAPRRRARGFGSSHEPRSLPAGAPARPARGPRPRGHGGGADHRPPGVARGPESGRSPGPARGPRPRVSGANARARDPAPGERRDHRGSVAPLCRGHRPRAAGPGRPPGRRSPGRACGRRGRPAGTGSAEPARALLRGGPARRDHLGSRTEPRLEGMLRLLGAGLRVRGFPARLVRACKASCASPSGAPLSKT